MKRLLSGFTLLLFVVSTALAADDTSSVSVQRVKQPIDKTFTNVIASLERSGFVIAKQIDIGENLEKDSVEKNWADYNKRHLLGIRTAIVCAGKFANAIGNVDPTMLVICPLHVTVTQEGAWTRVQFIKPAAIARGTPAEGIAIRLQAKLEGAIREGLAAH